MEPITRTVDEFIAGDFIPAVKGIGYTPGSGGFPNIVPTGNSGIGNMIKVAGKGGRDGGTSFWWNAGSDTSLDLYDMAHGSITYANAARLQTQADRAMDIAPKFGMDTQTFHSMIKSGNYEGSVVFGRLPKNITAGYVGGESAGEGVQAVDEVVPYRTMKLPSNIEYHPGGARAIRSDGSKVSLNKSDLQAPEFHDWMKSFAKNLKETLPEGATLPKGAQELLDAPFMDEGTTALQRYLENKYPGKYPNAAVTSIMPDAEGTVGFKFGEIGTTGKVMRSSIDENLVRTTPALAAKITANAPVAKMAVKEAEQVSAMISSSTIKGPRVISAATSKALARVPRTAVMSPKTLENLLQSAMTATKIMR
jgi:hypothetical protein